VVTIPVTEKIEIPKGSIEYIPVFVNDRLNNLTDLSAANPSFTIRRESDEQDIVTNQPGTPVGMTVYCLIDTTNIPKNRYELLVKFANPPEIPILGPFDFEVV